MPQWPRRTDKVVVQTRSYDETSMLAQASAAIVAPSRTAAPPVSVRRNARNGVWAFRAQAVRPEKGDGRVAPLAT
jgi:hypothetical protein